MSEWSKRVDQMMGATTYEQLQEAIEHARAEVWRFTAAVKDQTEAFDRSTGEMRELLGEIKIEIGEALGKVEDRLRSVEADVAVLRARDDIEQMNEGRIVLG